MYGDHCLEDWSTKFTFDLYKNRKECTFRLIYMYMYVLNPRMNAISKTISRFPH